MSDYAHPKPNSGFSLIEALVAIAILLTVVSGVMLLVDLSIQSGQNVSNRLAASYLASDAIEYLRYERDSEWLSSGGSFDNWVGNLPNCTDNTCRVDTRYNNEEIKICSDPDCTLEYDSSQKEYGYGIGSDSPYTRTVEFIGKNNLDPDSGDSLTDELIVRVTVSWEAAGGTTKELVLTETLSSWGD